jgi:hypothetical protein
MTIPDEPAVRAQHPADADRGSTPRTAQHIAEIITVVQDQQQGEVLFTLPGAVVLPRGTLVQLASGELARVESLRLIAPTPPADTARLVAQVVRTRRAPVALNPASLSRP